MSRDPAKAAGRAALRMECAKESQDFTRRLMGNVEGSIKRIQARCRRQSLAAMEMARQIMPEAYAKQFSCALQLHKKKPTS